MHALFRPIALVLAVSAMLLRALVPEGWMPAAATAPLTICTDQSGMRDMPMGSHLRLDHGSPHNHGRICPFAALAQAAMAAKHLPLPLPVVASPVVGPGARAALVLAIRVHRNQSPRAPPLHA